MSRVSSCVRPRARRGFALPAAIIALVLLSALVAGALFVATEELRAGRGDIADQRALAAAEWALERALAAWDATRNAADSVGVSAPPDTTTLPDGDRVEVTATRVQRRSVWMTASAMSRSDGRAIPARHTIGASLRLVGPAFPLRAALTAGNAVTVVEGGIIDGRDAVPPGWDARRCVNDAGSADASASSVASVAGVAVPAIAMVCGTTCAGVPPPGVNGTPAVQATPVPVLDATQAFGDETLGELTRRATITLDGGMLAVRPSVTNAACDRGDPLNWGDPGGAPPCASHFPLVRVRGSATLATGSAGQGVLLVDGALRVDSGARFVGVVIARDDIVVAGPGAEILGVAFAGAGDASVGSRVADGGAIRFSGCAVRSASLGVSRITRTPVRWWAELR